MEHVRKSRIRLRDGFFSEAMSIRRPEKSDSEDYMISKIIEWYGTLQHKTIREIIICTYFSGAALYISLLIYACIVGS